MLKRLVFRLRLVQRTRPTLTFVVLLWARICILKGMGQGTRTPFTFGGKEVIVKMFPHYFVFRNGSLSSKLGTPKLLKALDIVPDNTMDLTATIEAYMPGLVLKP